VIVDTSAIVAILCEEPGYEGLVALIAADTAPKMSAASLAELTIVMGAKGLPAQLNRITLLLNVLGIAIVPLDKAQALTAGSAWAKFGRLSGSRAKLNYGDCMTYALAAVTGEPLLYVGDDFTHTDLQRAVPDRGDNDPSPKARG
jgi:ribonuclease VapC